jgi:hypothetical protein
VSPPREKPRARCSRGPLEITGLADRPPSYRVDALSRRRAKREADRLIQALRAQLDGLESGEIPFAVAACTVDVLGSLLADIALRGELAS